MQQWLLFKKTFFFFVYEIPAFSEMITLAYFMDDHFIA